VNPTKTRRTRRPKQEGKHRCKGCDKISFPTQDKAYAAALRLSRIVGAIRVYPCPHAPGWHLTRRYDWVST
jgi:hypothetical protein